MSNKVENYKVWVHIEGLNEDGDCIEGDEYFEPREAGCVKTAEEAESLRDSLINMNRVFGFICTICGQLNRTCTEKYGQEHGDYADASITTNYCAECDKHTPHSVRLISANQLPYCNFLSV